MNETIINSIKFKKLINFIKRFKRIIVAFSGGVDSSTLAGICNEITDTLAITIVSPTTPSREIKEAIRIASELNLKHRLHYVNELTDKNFVLNTPNRCYYCKRIVLSLLLKIAEEENYDAVFEGTNASELRGHRPGYRAILEMEKVYSPWAMFGFTKEEIRKIAKEKGYSFWNKPSVACLSSRIPFYNKIDITSLNIIDEAENYIIDIANVKQVRVRKINNNAIIEVGPDEIEKLLNKKIIDAIVNKLKKLGFKSILLDLEGYKTGKLSEMYISKNES